MKKEKEKEKKPYRTTLSLPDDLAPRLERVANGEGIAEIEAVRRAVRQYVESHEAKSGAEQVARELGDLSRGLRNPYQELVANWRLNRTKVQMNHVAANNLILDVWPAEIYILIVLTELLQKLTEQDEFLVVTNLQFWHDALQPESKSVFGQQSAELYLKAQMQAIERGMPLYRIFLVSQDDLKSRACGLEQHTRFLARAKEIGKVEVRYKAYDSTKDDARLLTPFACIRRRPVRSAGLPAPEDDQGCLVVAPNYVGASSEICDLRLLFSRGASHEDPAVKFYIDRFLHAADTSRPLDELPDSAGKSQPEPTLSVP